MEQPAVKTRDHLATRIVIRSRRPFDEVRHALESQLGRSDFPALERLATTLPPEDAEARFAELGGPGGLMILAEADHGTLLRRPGSGRARLYLVGTPLVGRRLAAIDPAIGLYVPPRLYLYEDAGVTYLSYDRPSSQLESLGHEALRPIARTLDARLDELARRATGVLATTSPPRLTRTMYVLAVPDLKSSAAYYERVLGFTVREIGDPGWRIFQRDQARIMAGDCPGSTPPADLGDHSYFAYIEVEGIDDYCAAVSRAGAKLLKPVRDEPWGMREFGVTTLDGHRIMFGVPIRKA